jgi:pimeloyl-ACP methyl ester carboxylesterase
VLLVADAGSSGLVWPDDLIARLAVHHRVIRYDHRDTGRSTRSFDERPYELADLARDAVAVLDAFEEPHAHVVGMGLGGLLTQLLLLDHPDRLTSATLLCCAALPGPDDGDLPGPDPGVLRLRAEIDDPRDPRAELAWRVAHWRLVHGAGIPFDGLFFRAMEQRVIAHAGTDLPCTAHAHLDVPARGAELAGVTVPALVVEATEDPVHPPPHAGHLAAVLGDVPVVRIPGMGHAVGPAVVAVLAATILGHAADAC